MAFALVRRAALLRDADRLAETIGALGSAADAAAASTKTREAAAAVAVSGKGQGMRSRSDASSVLARKQGGAATAAATARASGIPLHSCVSAGHLFRRSVEPRIRRFERLMTKLGHSPEGAGGRGKDGSEESKESGGKGEGKDEGKAELVSAFPFTEFFGGEEEVKKNMGQSAATAAEFARVAFRNLRESFSEIEEYRAFELSAVRTPKQRGEYLLTHMARVIAMTCTHAALVRSRLVELGFEYDSLVMEEAGQVSRAVAETRHRGLGPPR